MKTAGLVLATAALLQAALAAAAATAQDPKDFVLRPTDMPVDFKQTKVRYVTNTQASKEAAVKKNLARLGRVLGYESTYRKQATRGILVVISRATTYKTAVGARESLELDIAAAEKSRTLRFRRVALATAVGDEAHMYRATVRQGRTTVDVYTLAWRSRTTYAAVIGTGIAGTGKPWFVVKLARRQQARIARP